MKTQLKTTQQEIAFNAGVQALAEEIAREFRHQRKIRGWTQDEAAIECGCSDASISNLENPAVLSGQAANRGFPSMELLRAACSAYGISDGRIIERSRHLRKLAGIPGDMRNRSGVGRKAPRRAKKWTPKEPVRHVDEFDFPILQKPGLSKDLLCMIAVWCAVIGLAVIQFFYLIK